jgi:predicted amidohydrolase
LDGRKIRSALVQMDCIIKNKEGNLSKAFGFLDELEGQADIVCFPELFTTGYNLDLIGDDFYELAEPIPGPTTEWMGQKAREYGLAVVGTIVERDNAREGVLYDTTFLLDAKGQLVGKYRKSHLYPTEHRYFRAGDRLPVFELGGFTVGVAICFEHAFPQVFTILALQGVEVVFIPSAVPVGYEYLLNLRTRARAQDNQLFTVAVNRVGREGDVTYCGLSKVVTPRGEVIAEASQAHEELLVAELDLDLILKERKQEPVLRSLRPELYRPLVELGR